MERLRSMSQSERREFMQSLSAADRQRMFARFQQQGGEGRRAQRVDPASPKPGFVFVDTPAGQLTLTPIMIGLSDWEHTEVVAGLQEAC
jgi:hypothetical protein